MSDVTLAIVAGGQGRRLGGVDKGLLTLPDGTPLLRHLLDQLNRRPWREVLIITRPDQAEAYAPHIDTARLIFDRHGPGLGPLAALHAALSASASDWVQLWPVDAPIVCPDLLDALTTAVPPALVPQDAQRLQPLFGRYHRQLLPSLENHLETGKLAMTRWVRDENLPPLPWPDGRCFANLNRPEDLILLEQIQ